MKSKCTRHLLLNNSLLRYYSNTKQFKQDENYFKKLIRKGVEGEQESKLNELASEYEEIGKKPILKKKFDNENNDDDDDDKRLYEKLFNNGDSNKEYSMRGTGRKQYDRNKYKYFSNDKIT